MKRYGQFCPVAKATEVLAERWTPLLIRELLCGSHRFNDLQRGVPLMSRSLLSKRLKELQQAGIVERRQPDKGPEYHLTPAGLELRPIIEMLGVWGQRWVRTDYGPEDLDPSLLMWDIRRTVSASEVPQDRVVVRFTFNNVRRQGMKRWWLVISKEDADLCLTDPGFGVDIDLTTDLTTLTRIWMGDRSLEDAVREGSLDLTGPTWLVRSLPEWIGRSQFAGVQPAPVH